MRKMINTSPKVSKVSKMLHLDVNFKDTKEVLNTQRGTWCKMDCQLTLCMVLLVHYLTDVEIELFCYAVCKYVIIARPVSRS